MQGRGTYLPRAAGVSNLYAGPWEQPPDGSYVDTPVISAAPRGTFTSDIINAYGTGSPDFSSAWSHPTSSPPITLYESVQTSSIHSEWIRRIIIGTLDLTGMMPSPGPTLAEQSNPHYVSWEAEAADGTPTSPIAVTFSVVIEPLESYDDVEHKTTSPAPDVMQGTTQVRRLDASTYTVDSFGNLSLVSDVWPSAAFQGAAGLLAETSLLTGKTLALNSNGGYTDNVVDATPQVTSSLTYDFAAAGLDGGIRAALLFTLSRWVAGDVLSEPQVVIPGPEGQTTHGGYKGNTGGPSIVTFTATATFTYRPPRYRILYDRPPRLRQYPRDDSLGGAPRQGRESRSVQGSARQGWQGAYR